MNSRLKTRELLLTHYRLYPKLQIEDIFKFLYQSAFGCEHSVSSLSKVTEYIIKEYNTLSAQSSSTPELLDGNYFRLPLSYLNNGLLPETLGKLFFASAKYEKEGLADLIEKLKIADELVNENLLPFSKAQFKTALENWKSSGYPAIHHSEIFKNEYNPSYRVISKEFMPFLPLLARIDTQLGQKGIVAIEGGSASGKTTLAKLLKTIYDCTVFHMDDFFLRPEQRTPERYSQIGGNIDKERFLAEILIPLSKGDEITLQRFDCSKMELALAEKIIPRKLVIIEGAYSMHPEFMEFYDFSVFLNISNSLQKKRILKRNSPHMAERFFNDWIPMEQKYFSHFKIPEKCDMKIDIIEI